MLCHAAGEGHTDAIRRGVSWEGLLRKGLGMLGILRGPGHTEVADPCPPPQPSLPPLNRREEGRPELQCSPEAYGGHPMPLEGGGLGAPHQAWKWLRGDFKGWEGPPEHHLPNWASRAVSRPWPALLMSQPPEHLIDMELTPPASP